MKNLTLDTAELDYFYVSSPTIETIKNDDEDTPSILNSIELTFPLNRESSLYTEKLLITLYTNDETTLDEIIEEASLKIIKEMEEIENDFTENTTDVENLLDELREELKNHLKANIFRDLEKLSDGPESDFDPFFRKLILLKRNDAELFEEFVEDSLPDSLERMDVLVPITRIIRILRAA